MAKKKILPAGQVNRNNNQVVEKIRNIMNVLGQKYSIKVGILQPEGSKKVEGTDLNMAELGAVHEFGATINVTEKMRNYLHSQGLHLRKDTTQINIPARSFLRTPILGAKGRKEIEKAIENNIPDDLNDAKDLKENTISKLMDDLAHEVAVAALLQVQKAFYNDGIKPPTKDISKKMRKYNPAAPTLVDRGTTVGNVGLLGSISYEVKKVK